MTAYGHVWHIGPVPRKRSQRAVIREASIRKEYSDLPVIETRLWDLVPEVNQAISEHDGGRFYASAGLCDAMLRDDRIQGVFGTRFDGLLGRALTFEVSKTAPSGAEEIAADLDAAWPRMFPQETLSELLRWGRFIGVGLGELIWEDWEPRLKVWNPKFLYWNWATKSYWLTTQDEHIEITPGDGKWVLYTPYGYQRGWITGLVRALSLPWLIRKFTYRDWSRYCEVHGLPIRAGIVPTSAKQEHKDRFTRELAAVGSESTVQLNQNGKDGPNFDLKLVEAMANTWEGFDKLLEKAEDSIAITVLGQNLTTSVKGGSHAAARVHQDVRVDFRRADANSLATTLRNQALVHWVRFNYSMDDPEELTPTPSWEVEDPENKTDAATGLNQLGDAVNKLQQGGMAVDVAGLAQKFDIPVLGDGVLAPEDRPGQPQQGDDEPEEGQEPNDDEKPGKAQRHARGREKRGYVAGQEYADSIVESARRTGAKALQPDLAAVLKVVRAAKTAEDLRQGLLDAFGEMRPSALARVLQKATVLARLNGQISALEDL